ncbi:recombinase family protein [Pseudarthrobacter cellobiosi]|uniref:recombinase family protein n=1 Tax=Pseudarthrobacter cellobiosi TaxID=2953654 RepID=UPI00403F2703
MFLEKTGILGLNRRRRPEQHRWIKVKDLLDFAGGLSDSGIGFISLTDAIDTTTASGRFFFNVMASLAQMERELMAGNEDRQGSNSVAAAVSARDF